MNDRGYVLCRGILEPQNTCNCQELGKGSIGTHFGKMFMPDWLDLLGYKRIQTYFGKVFFLGILDCIFPFMLRSRAAPLASALRRWKIFRPKKIPIHFKMKKVF